MKKIILIISATISVFYLSNPIVFADDVGLKKVSVFYRPDGGVSITIFVKDYCNFPEETETQCMDRLMVNTNEYNMGWPYDDMDRDDLPKDRSERDKWQGKKGKGVQIKHSLISKQDKVKEYRSELEVELEKPEPNSSRVLKLQYLIEKVADLDHKILTQEDLKNLEGKKRSLFAAVIDAVGDLVKNTISNLKDGFLTLKSLLVEKIQIGTVEKPAGITTYDLETRQPYCQVVRGGKLELIAGECPTEFTSQVEPQIENVPDQNTISAASGVSDTEAPVITVQGPSLIEFEKGTNWVDPGATVTDNINPNIGLYHKVDGVITGNNGRDLPMIDTGVAGEHLISYSAADDAGNISVATRTVKVVDSTVEANIETVVGTSETTVVSEQPTGAVSEAGVVSDQPSAAE